MTLRKLASAFGALFLFMAPASLSADLTDVAGRTVHLALPANRVIVGEARQVHVIAALKGEHTFDTIVGWRDDLLKKDPDSYAAYVEHFPAIEKLPRFGYVPQGDFDLETAITLQPDVITLNLESAKVAKESGFEAKAAAANIQIVYLDFVLTLIRTRKSRLRCWDRSLAPKTRRKNSSPIGAVKSPA